MNRHHLSLVLLLLCPIDTASADGAWVREVLDGRGRVVGAVPRQHTTIGMAGERVTLIPYYDASVSEHPLVFVNVRYEFQNPGDATTLSIGFPELNQGVLEQRMEDWYEDAPADFSYYPCHGSEYDEYDEARVTCPESIDRFYADVEGHPVDIRVSKGEGEYRRWFVFDAAFGKQRTLRIRNLYTARLGYLRWESNDFSELDYHLSYVLHTGGTWNGSIGRGVVEAWVGGRRVLKEFEDLRPLKRDDIEVPLPLTRRVSLGRPYLGWDYGNGSEWESVPPTFVRDAVVRASSHLSGEALSHIAPMALDGDPETAWIDGGESGGAGQWLQIPTWSMGRLRGMKIRSGSAGTAPSPIKRLSVVCLDQNGNQNDISVTERISVTLEDTSEAQRVLFERPLGECYAVRLEIDALHGPAGSHAAIAEVELVGTR